MGLYKPSDQIDQSGFSRTVGADHPEDLASGQFEIDLVNRFDPAEGLVHLFDLQESLVVHLPIFTARSSSMRTHSRHRVRREGYLC